MKLKVVVTCAVIVLLSISSELFSQTRIPAKNVIGTDANDKERNLQDIINQILPTDPSSDLTNLIVGSTELNVLDGISSSLTASELNILDGISANVTAANLNALTGGGQTSLHSHAGGAKTLDGAYDSNTLDNDYDNDASGDAQITVDARDISFDLNDATNDYKIKIDNTTTGTINDGLFFTTTGVGGVLTDAIDASDGGITNAINVGGNTITGTTATIDFTNFDIDNSGNETLAGDLTLTSGATISSTSNGDIAINPNGTGILTIGTASDGTGVHIRGDLSISGNISNPVLSGLIMTTKNLSSMVSKVNLELQKSSSIQEFKAAIPEVVEKLKIWDEQVQFSKNEPITFKSAIRVKAPVQVEGGVEHYYYSESLGNIRSHSEESLKPMIVDRGEAELEQGEIYIPLSPQFLALVMIDEQHPLFVKTTLLSDRCHELAVIERTPSYFRVKELYGGKSNCPFIWEISAEKKIQ